MKKLLLISLISISFQLISQAEGEMLFHNRNKIEYNGELIKIKKAIKLAEDISQEAKANFVNAKWLRLRSTGEAILVPTFLLGGIIEITEEAPGTDIALSFLLSSSCAIDLLNTNMARAELLKTGIELYNNALKQQ